MDQDFSLKAYVIDTQDQRDPEAPGGMCVAAF